jgi:hypothetical protein
LNGRSRLAIPGMLLPSPIRPFYPISRPLKTLQQNQVKRHTPSERVHRERRVAVVPTDLNVTTR